MDSQEKQGKEKEKRGIMGIQDEAVHYIDEHCFTKRSIMSLSHIGHLWDICTASTYITLTSQRAECNILASLLSTLLLTGPSLPL